MANFKKNCFIYGCSQYYESYLDGRESANSGNLVRPVVVKKHGNQVIYLFKCLFPVESMIQHNFQLLPRSRIINMVVPR